MRKVSPEGVRDDFRDQLNGLLLFHLTGLTAFTKKADQSTLTERSLLAIAVAWEGFISDLFIAYINRDATKFKQHLLASLEAQVGKNPKAELVFKSWGGISFPKHFTKAEIQSLADNRGNNITFPVYADLEAQARTWLIPNHAAKFSGLTPKQKACVDALVALRNHIAHRSQRSLDAMNQTMLKGALRGTGLQRSARRFHDVGVWLKATPPGHQTTRLSIIMTMLQGIAATF